MTAMPTLTNSVQRQLRYSVSTPPSSMPIAAPEPAIPPKTANAVARSLASVNVVDSSDSAAGASMAPATPCRARAVTSVSKFGEAPPSAEAAAKPTRPIRNIARRPMTSETRPNSSSRLPNASE